MNTDLVKVTKARRYVGFYALYRGDSRLPWEKVCNAAGLPVLYKTKEAALERAAEHARVDMRVCQ